MKTQNNDSYNGTELESLKALENVKPIPKTIESEVTISLTNGLLNEYCNELFAALSTYALSKNVNIDEIGFTQDLLTKYCRTLVVSRVAYVRQDNRDVIVGPHEWGVRCPAGLYVLLSQIGRVEDTQYGVNLKPVMAKEESIELLNKEEMLKFAKVLNVFIQLGVTMSEGYGTNRDGHVMAMTTFMMNDEIVRHDREAHPSMTLAAAVFSLRTVEDAIYGLRINYGTKELYKKFVRILATPSNKVA